MSTASFGVADDAYNFVAGKGRQSDQAAGCLHYEPFSDGHAMSDRRAGNALPGERGTNRVGILRSNREQERA